jgi:hypothetical protein
MSMTEAASRLKALHFSQQRHDDELLVIELIRSDGNEMKGRCCVDAMRAWQACVGCDQMARASSVNAARSGRFGSVSTPSS